jgi:hypothetical protein
MSYKLSYIHCKEKLQDSAQCFNDTCTHIMGCDADHSPPPSVEVKNENELYLLSPPQPLSWHVVEQL